MLVGVPKEIKNNEFRVGMVPASVQEVVAAGHSVWGINQGPSTGKAMAELILDGEATSLDISRFSLDRFYST